MEHFQKQATVNTQIAQYALMETQYKFPLFLYAGACALKSTASVLYAHLYPDRYQYHQDTISSRMFTVVY